MKELLKDAKVDVIALSSDIITTSGGSTGSDEGSSSGSGNNLGG